MLDPIAKTIEVPCGQEKAFGVFVSEMGSWWPLDQRSMSLMQTGTPAKSLEVEPKLGGRIVEIAVVLRLYDRLRDRVQRDFLELEGLGIRHQAFPSEGGAS